MLPLACLVLLLGFALGQFPGEGKTQWPASASDLRIDPIEYEFDWPIERVAIIGAGVS
jgi:hypothetical protein